MDFGKQVIKTYLRNWLGIEIHRFKPNASATAQIIYTMNNFNIDLVLDVGANKGQFSEEIRSGGYSGKIVSFEPLSTAHLLLQQASEKDAKWSVYQRCAMGGEIGEVEINIAGNSASSSLLPMLDSHLSAAPFTAYIGREAVPLLTLDAVVPEFIGNAKNTFLKIDTQGFEWDVLNGAQNVLPNVRVVLLELSLIPLYEGQHLWKEMVERLEGAGFVLWALLPGFTDSRNGRTLQADGIFVRE